MVFWIGSLMFYFMEGEMNLLREESDAISDFGKIRRSDNQQVTLSQRIA